jgi:UDP-N-acetylglucosamine--N-acetylmuramyl-(pentapeptide) pyrophosphoryl-undecaprenol N-acetylglucosamine transferase
MRVLLAGGGSAGHIEPALALADALRRADPGTEITCVGTERGLETRLIPLRGYPLELIPAVPLARSASPAKQIALPARMAKAVSAAAKIIDRTRADVLVGFGGYVSTPCYLAARRRGIPIVVHEANPKAGIANRVGARFTTHVFTGHPDTEIRHGKYLGIPIRREIAELDRLAAGDKARAHFGLRTDLPVLLVTGGSQGARSLNAAVFGAAGWLRDASIQVLHIIGPRNGADAPASVPGVPYVAVPYIDRMDLAYAAADFALCRAGAMTCAELTAVGLPAAYVPLPIGNGEQRLNAIPIVQRGGGMLVPDDELTPDWIRDKLLPVLVNIDQVADMSAAAASLGRGDADRWLAQAVIDVVQQERPGVALREPAGQIQQPPASQPSQPPAGQPPQPPGPPRQEPGPPRQEPGPPRHEPGPPWHEPGPPWQESGPVAQEPRPPWQELGPVSQEPRPDPRQAPRRADGPRHRMGSTPPPPPPNPPQARNE